MYTWAHVSSLVLGGALTEFTRTLALSEELVICREGDHGRHPGGSRRVCDVCHACNILGGYNEDLMSTGHEPRRRIEESRPEILIRACPPRLRTISVGVIGPE